MNFKLAEISHNCSKMSAPRLCEGAVQKFLLSVYLCRGYCTVYCTHCTQLLFENFRMAPYRPCWQTSFLSTCQISVFLKLPGGKYGQLSILRGLCKNGFEYSYLFIQLA